jgi:hypothetical protein
VSRPAASPPAPAGAAPAARPPAAGFERIVALALAAMAAVLAIALVDSRRAPPTPPPPAFDFQNPMLFAQPGQCIELEDDASPGLASRLVVRSEGVVLRPNDLMGGLKGWVSMTWTDPRKFPAFLACDGSAAPPAGVPAGTPPPRSEPLVFPLGWFGMPLESRAVLRSILPVTVSWNGSKRVVYQANMMAYAGSSGGPEGPWEILLSRDAPVLGVVRRRFYAGKGEQPIQMTVRVPPNCR